MKKGELLRTKRTLSNSTKPSCEVSVRTEPMEARPAEKLPDDAGQWLYEPKWDGFRCLAFKADDSVDLRAKSGKPLGRYFPEIVSMLRGLEAREFVVDGEIVIDLGGLFSFAALQMRLHPVASRIKKLSLETPAKLILFDMLAGSGANIIDQPLRGAAKVPAH